MSKKVRYKVRYVTEVIVKDPETKGDVVVEIFKDLTTGGLFGIDSSYLEQVEQGKDICYSPFSGEIIVIEKG